jgi:hypothetical protein
MPRFDSEYLAAFAQLLGVIAAEADEVINSSTKITEAKKRNATSRV